MAKKQTKPKKGFYAEYIEPFMSALLIALVIRAVVIYPFRIPTGSMKDSLLIGDFLLANKFVYGIRTPDWIGIPYTKLGFEVPFIRLPGFREPKQGDVVIFKYPRDISLNYIKRCIAVSGDTVVIDDKKVYVNGVQFPDAPKGKYVDPYIRPKDQPDYGMTRIYPPGAGNRDNFGPIRIPAPGDTFLFSEETRNERDWIKWLQIAVYEGHKIEVVYRGEQNRLTVDNFRLWPKAIGQLPASAFRIDGQPLDHYTYTVTNTHYFMMGDNRDDSLDSRYWGFLPERLVVGEALIIYWSWDSELPFYRLLEKVRWGRILNLIH
jgi:signal peptidase I